MESEPDEPSNLDRNKQLMRLMTQHQVRRLPVVEEDGRLVGVIAQADVARSADDRRTGEFVEEISK